MRKQRLRKLVTSQDPAVIAMRGTERHKKVLRRSGKLPAIGQASATSKVVQRIAWRNLLISSVDDRELASHPEVPKIHNWVTSGSALMTGKEFVGCVQIRGKTMSTAMRRSRGVRPDIRRTECDCCRRPETLGHIMQVCPRTLGPRISRHDYICSFLAITLSLKGLISEQSLSYQSKVVLKNRIWWYGRKRMHGLLTSLLLPTTQI